jgi:hypothetical protein
MGDSTRSRSGQPVPHQATGKENVHIAEIEDGAMAEMPLCISQLDSQSASSFLHIPAEQVVEI